MLLHEFTVLRFADRNMHEQVASQQMDLPKIVSLSSAVICSLLPLF
jgi:hypothetical protein